MFAMYKAWRQQREQRRDSASYKDGYQYAAGLLVEKGPSQANHLLNTCYETAGDMHPFDKGVMAAVFDFQDRLEEFVLRPYPLRK